MSLDPISEIESLQTENDYLRERLKLAEDKLRASLASLMAAKNELAKLEASFREERREVSALLEEFTEAVDEGRNR